MEIKNLSQLKKAVNNGCCFTIVQHYRKPECSGQKRKPNVIQTNGFYSIVLDNPNHPLNLNNRGRGTWFAYGKASDWTFENGLCKYAHRGVVLWDIKFED